jgi:hypothetical protein
MLQIKPQAMVDIAATKGWLHTRGKLQGTINAAAMADGLGVATSTISRAYDGGQLAGPVLVERLVEASGLSFDELLEIVQDEQPSVAVSA